MTERRRDGVLREDEMGTVVPSAERLARGPVVIVECVENIPCNPCVAACPKGAITIRGDINDTPVVDFETCDGCAVCISACPGLAIFAVDATGDPARVSIPYEYRPLPEVGEVVTTLDREGAESGEGKVVRVLSAKVLDRTPIVTLEVPGDLAMRVRHFRRKNGRKDDRGEEHLGKGARVKEDVIICRCEDITYGEIVDAVRGGLTTTEEIKRILRCGMGPCQGRTCSRLIARIISQETGVPVAEVRFPVVRPPTRPVEIGVMAAGGPPDGNPSGGEYDAD